MSVNPATRTRPNLSAITPPNGLMINIEIVADATTNPSTLAEPFFKCKIPKERAIGPIPFPRFDTKRAIRNRFTYLCARTLGKRTIT